MPAALPRGEERIDIFRTLHHRKRPVESLELKKRTPLASGSGVNGHFGLSLSLSFGGCFLGGVFGLASGAGRAGCF